MLLCSPLHLICQIAQLMFQEPSLAKIKTNRLHWQRVWGFLHYIIIAANLNWLKLRFRLKGRRQP